MCGPLFEAHNDAVALRAFHSMMRNSPTGNSDDFELWQVGSINQGDMTITIFKNKVPYTYAEAKEASNEQQNIQKNIRG